MDNVNISTFKATCLSLLRKVKQTGEPLLVTLRGEPVAQIVPPESAPRQHNWLGSARETGRIAGDLLAPTGEVWEAERGSS